MDNRQTLFNTQWRNVEGQWKAQNCQTLAHQVNVAYFVAYFVRHSLSNLGQSDVSWEESPHDSLAVFTLEDEQIVWTDKSSGI